MQDKVIGIYCLIDDMLKGIKHPEDVRRHVSDSEVITTAVVSAMYFSGRHQPPPGRPEPGLVDTQVQHTGAPALWRCRNRAA